MDALSQPHVALVIPLHNLSRPRADLLHPGLPRCCPFCPHSARRRNAHPPPIYASIAQGSYTRRETTTGSEKKPLNPILGEQFYGDFTTAAKGQLRLVAEQVSHHPPVTAFNISTAQGDKGSSVRLEGHFAQKTTFSGKSIMVKQVGHAIIRVQAKDGAQESYLITLPKLRIDGLFFGSP